MAGRHGVNFIAEGQRVGECIDTSVVRQGFEVAGDLDEVPDLSPLVGGERLAAVEDSAAEQGFLHVGWYGHGHAAHVQNGLNLLRLQRATHVENWQHIESNCQYLWIGVFQATSVSVC